jgi:uncharacterized protein (DUF1015 family)
MAIVKPFAALRPKPELAARICELPYDVLSSNEARERAAGNPFSFFRVSKPEIDLPATLDPCHPQVYEKGKRNFARFLGEGWLCQDPQPCFYLYRQVMGSHSQVGLVAVASCEEYLRNRIRKHELTRPDKEADRVRHIEALNAQTGPAFLAYRAEPALDALFAQRIAGTPDVDFSSPDGVRHSAWTLRESEDIASVQMAFEGMRYLYIADGHHRTAAAAQVYQRRKGTGNSRYFLAVIFPHNQLQILPYNRVLNDLNGLSPEALLAKLQTVFTIRLSDEPQPARKHEFGFYCGGRWRSLQTLPALTAASDPLEQLDVALLQKHVLGPIFGIDDPRTSQRISFVGGIRGTGELERLVNGGGFACAFSMFPTGMEDLMAVADAGELMPPKSTWFEPKLRDAMFCHLI